MPAFARSRVRQGCLFAARHILKSAIPEVFSTQAIRGCSASADELDLVSEWYAGLNLSCPFLDSRICSIYENRPLSCREYFIAGDANACSGGAGPAERVEMPVRMSEILAWLACELEGADIEAIILSLALIWADENAARDCRRWPADKVAGRLVELLSQMVQENCAVGAESR